MNSLKKLTLLVWPVLHVLANVFHDLDAVGGISDVVLVLRAGDLRMDFQLTSAHYVLGRNLTDALAHYFLRFVMLQVVGLQPINILFIHADR